MLEHIFHAQIGPATWLLSSDRSDPADNLRTLLPGKATANSYLLKGQEYALLIDMAVDEPGLIAYAERLAGVPVHVVLTHGHPDHIYRLDGASTSVWMHPDDVFLLRDGFIGHSVSPMPIIHSLRDGDMLQLGMRKVRIIHIPGHTPGSILLLDTLTGVLFSGDTVARRLLWGLHGSVPFSDFCRRLASLQKLPISGIYSAHDRFALPPAHIRLMLEQLSNVDESTLQPLQIPVPGRYTGHTFGNEENPAYFDLCCKLQD